MGHKAGDSLDSSAKVYVVSGLDREELFEGFGVGPQRALIRHRIRKIIFYLLMYLISEALY